MLKIKRLPKFGHNYRYLNRYREIISILIKYGFGDLIIRSGLERFIDLSKLLTLVGKSKETYLTRAERIRMSIEELGPTFIKFGQIMANRPDLISSDIIDELTKLQDRVKPFSGKDAKLIVEKEFGKSIEDVFAKFDEEPLATASIAQVHKGMLYSGETVAIKIRRPGILQIIEVDLEIISHLSSLMERHVEGVRELNLTGIVAEFDKAIKKEVNFNFELKNMERFRKNFKDKQKIYVPAIYKDYSSKNILTMEYVDGIKLSQIDNFSEMKIHYKEIIGSIVDLMMKQIFDYGFFHADPHPGNIFIIPHTQKICFLDFGVMGTIPADHREYLSSIIIGIVTGDTRKIMHSVIKISNSTVYEIDDYQALEQDVASVIDQYTYQSISDINMGEIVSEVLQAFIKHRLKVSPNLYLLGKAIVTLEGVCRKLDPSYNLVEHIKPWAKKFLKNKINPLKIGKDFYGSLSDFALLLRDLPAEASNILEQVKRGKLKIEFEHKGLEPVMEHADKISNRLVASIVISSIVIGSSVIIHSGVAPKWYGIPIIGLIGYLAAALMGFVLLIAIFRHGRM